MKIYQPKKWGKIIIDGEGSLTIMKNNLSALTVDESITKHRILITNFNFYGARDGLMNKLRTLYYVAKYIFKKEEAKQDKG